MIDAGDWNKDPPSQLSSEAPSSLGASELPEVRELVASGWHIAPDEPLFAFLPAVWPASHRTWVADRGTVYSEVFIGGQAGRLVPASAESVAAFDNDMARWCEDAGVPARPTGRVWLLRLPQGSPMSLEEVLELARSRAIAAGLRVRSSREFTEVTVETLEEVFGDA